MIEMKAFTFGLGQYMEDGSPCVVAFDGEKNPRLASDEKFYLQSEADKVIAYKDKEIADLIEKNKRLARKDLIMASETIKDLEESHKKEVGQLLMEIAGLKKLVETADKLLKQRGGFTVKEITFNGVKLEGFKKEA